MGPLEFVIAVLGTLGFFGSPVLITRMIIRHRSKRIQVSEDDAAQLRAEMAALRSDVEATLADVTLQLDDLARNAVSGGDREPRLGAPPD